MLERMMMDGVFLWMFISFLFFTFLVFSFRWFLFFHTDDLRMAGGELGYGDRRLGVGRISKGLTNLDDD
jgi:hypothetical protein